MIARDEMVWRKAKQRNIPVMMLTSGGYTRETASLIAASIENLNTKGEAELSIDRTRQHLQDPSHLYRV